MDKHTSLRDVKWRKYCYNWELCVCVYKLSTQLLAKTTQRSPYQASLLVDTHKRLCLGGTVGRWWFCLVSVLSRIQRVRCASAPTSPLLSSLLQDLRERLGSIPDVCASIWWGVFEGKQYLSFLWIKSGGGRGSSRAVGWSFYDFSEFSLCLRFISRNPALPRHKEIQGV